MRISDGSSDVCSSDLPFTNSTLPVTRGLISGHSTPWLFFWRNVRGGDSFPRFVRWSFVWRWQIGCGRGWRGNWGSRGLDNLISRPVGDFELPANCVLECGTYDRLRSVGNVSAIT